MSGTAKTQSTIEKSVCNDGVMKRLDFLFFLEEVSRHRVILTDPDTGVGQALGKEPVQELINRFQSILNYMETGEWRYVNNVE